MAGTLISAPEEQGLQRVTLRPRFTIVNHGRMEMTKVINGSPRDILDNRGQSVLNLKQGRYSGTTTEHGGGRRSPSRMDQPDLRSALIGKIQDLDLSQREAAEAIGVSQQALSSWVSGDSIPSRRQSPRLAKWLDLPEETVRRMRLNAAAENQHGGIVSARLDHIEDELDSLVRQVEDLRRTQHRFVETVLRILPSIAAGALDEHVAGGVGELIDQMQRIETPESRDENQ